jgi:Domain of unknown function (DUF1413)
MATLLISIEEPLLHRLISDACASNISLDEQIKRVLSRADEAPPLMTSEKGLAIALDRAKAKNAGDEFTLEELFSDEEWSRIPSRRVFGRQFRQAIESTMPPVARHDRKTATNKAVYQRC